jgi:hypothetical protein
MSFLSRPKRAILKKLDSTDDALDSVLMPMPKTETTKVKTTNRFYDAAFPAIRTDDQIDDSFKAIDTEELRIKNNIEKNFTELKDEDLIQEIEKLETRQSVAGFGGDLDDVVTEDKYNAMMKELESRDTSASKSFLFGEEIATPKISNIEYQTKMSEFNTIEDISEWQTTVKDYVKTSREVNPDIRTPELEDSTRKLLDGNITREEHLKNIDEIKPVTSWNDLPREPSGKAVVFSLRKNQREDGVFALPSDEISKYNVSASELKVGDTFRGRLDIDAYKNYDSWVVAGDSSTANKGKTHYLTAIHYEGTANKPVKFLASQKTSERIGTGEIGKTGYARISGTVKDLNTNNIRVNAAEFLNNPEWTQVGFDPRRQGGFFVRAGENKHVPVREASEVIQIGPLVLAKNVVLDLAHKGYAKGGVIKKGLMSK